MTDYQPTPNDALGELADDLFEIESLNIEDLNVEQLEERLELAIAWFEAAYECTDFTCTGFSQCNGFTCNTFDIKVE